MNKKGNTKSNTYILDGPGDRIQKWPIQFFRWFYLEHGKRHTTYFNLPSLIIYFLGCTTGNIQRPQNPSAGCCATDLTSAMPAASWFDCFLLCEKRQRKHQDCEYFEFMNNDYAGMAEQRVDKTKKQ